MTDIDFQVNEFRTYKVVVEGVAFGFMDTQGGGYSPRLGEKFNYDGLTVRLHDGREIGNVPQLRSAIRAGWCVPAESDAKAARPKSAGIQVRGTKHVGSARPVKTTVEVETSDEREVVSVAARKNQRESLNEAAARKVPLESQEAKTAFSKKEAPTWRSGDSEIDELASLLSAEVRTKFPEEFESLEVQIEDIIAPSQESGSITTRSARSLPVDAQDDRVSMPIVRENTENAGDVVGNVSDQNRILVEREREYSIDVAQAKPAESPKPTPRLGGTGAVVVNEQRDMGAISLSNSKPAIRLEESASVKNTSHEMIRMGDKAQVGTKTAAARRPAPESDQGVAVGRILSPTKQSFVANDSNTSTSSIERTAQGKSLKIEKYAVEGAPEGKAAAVATGDVQEARTGDDLEDLLPDAAKTPEVHRRPEEDPKYATVRMMIPDFEWNKDRPAKERVADALKHIKNPMYVKGILAVETETVGGMIKEALAKTLSKAKKAKKA